MPTPGFLKYNLRPDEILNAVYNSGSETLSVWYREDEILNAVFMSGSTPDSIAIAFASGTHLPISVMPVSGTWALQGPLTISGSSVTIIGPTFIVTASHMYVQDNMITVNAGESGSGVTLGEAGLEVDRGTEPNFYFIFKEDSQTFRVGTSGSSEPVATREDSPVMYGIPYWNSASYDFKTTPSFNLHTASNHIAVPGIRNAGGTNNKIVRVSSSYNMTTNDSSIIVNASESAVTITLPPTSSYSIGYSYDITIKNVDNDVLIRSDSSESIWISSDEGNELAMTSVGNTLSLQLADDYIYYGISSAPATNDIVIVTASYAMSINDNSIIVSASDSAVTITLPPTSSAVIGNEYDITIKNADYAVLVKSNSSESIWISSNEGNELFMNTVGDTLTLQLAADYIYYFK